MDSIKVIQDDRMIEMMQLAHELFGLDNIQEIKISRVGDNVSCIVKEEDNIMKSMILDLFDLEML